jgi:DNA-directed RNA polymerase subunit RPC12/RpoP
MELLQIKCPTCQSAVLQYHTTYATQHHGRRIMYKCASCPSYFSETKKTLMAGLKTPVSVIWQVVKARTEGMGLNAAVVCPNQRLAVAPFLELKKSKRSFRTREALYFQ